MLFPLQIRFTHFLFRFLDANKDGANALDVVARTRELKKRHRVPLVMPDDQSKRAYARKRQTRSRGEEEEIEQEAIVQEEQDEEGVLARLLFLNDCLNAQGAKDEDLTACILELSSVEVAALLYLCLFVFLIYQHLGDCACTYYYLKSQCNSKRIVKVWRRGTSL